MSAVAKEIAERTATAAALLGAEAFVSKLDSLVPDAFKVFQLLVRDPTPTKGRLKNLQKKYPVAKDILAMKVKLMSGPQELQEILQSQVLGSAALQKEAEELLGLFRSNPEMRRAQLRLLDTMDREE